MDPLRTAVARLGGVQNLAGLALVPYRLEGRDFLYLVRAHGKAIVPQHLNRGGLLGKLPCEPCGSAPLARERHKSDGGRVRGLDATRRPPVCGNTFAGERGAQCSDFNRQRLRARTKKLQVTLCLLSFTYYNVRVFCSYSYPILVPIFVPFFQFLVLWFSILVRSSLEL